MRYDSPHSPILHALHFAPLATLTVVDAALHQRQKMPKLNDVKLLHLNPVRKLGLYNQPSYIEVF